MPLLEHHREGAVEWGLWELTEPAAGRFLPLLPPALLDEAGARFKSEARRMEWLAARALLAAMRGHYQPVAYHPTGRPFLPGSHGHISISHTVGYVAVALSDSVVGIDVEQYGQRVRRVASRFMGDDEEARPYQNDTTWGLLLHWSAKEAVFKCLDVAEIDFRKHLRVFPFTPAVQGTFLVGETVTPRRLRYEVSYRILPHGVLTRAVAVP